MTEKKFQELTIWGKNGERDLFLLVKNVMYVNFNIPLGGKSFFLPTLYNFGEHEILYTCT